jgi:hemerythrin
MEKRKVTEGVYWVEEPDANLYILCGCPADSIKHLFKKGLVARKKKSGVIYETGPNAILLSDISIQNGRFCNLAEFPVLQMLYRQGMIIPGHPGNTGIRPMLIGLEDQVIAQSKYIYRGNYGLTTMEEIRGSGISPDRAKQMMRVKTRFAFDRIRKTEELIEFRVIDRDAVELREGLFIHRKGINVYEFLYEDSSVTVDLNLSPQDDYIPPYTLDFHVTGRERFSIIHTGEGDGWDKTRPCMASVISYRGKIYLIDAGPNIIHSLTALGISVNEIEGIFHTHAHDDHFAGLTTLIRSNHRIHYFATPLVRRSVTKKLEALTGIGEGLFSRYFMIHDLEFDRWNNIDGLEVKPFFSPHPVETSVLFFRAPIDGGYRTYAHLADISSFKVLQNMVTDDPKKSGISSKFFDTVKKGYLRPVDLKKIDIGGGYIHGEAEDFSQDGSKKLLLSHTSLPLTDSQRRIGSSARFGDEDVLVPAGEDYFLEAAHRFLHSFFPEGKDLDFTAFKACPIEIIMPGQTPIKRGKHVEDLYLITSGLIDERGVREGSVGTMCAGSLAGEWSVLNKKPSEYTYLAKSYVRCLKIPGEIYLSFLTENKLLESMRKRHDLRRFLGRTRIFGDVLSCQTQNRIAGVMEARFYNSGERLAIGPKPQLFLLQSGGVEIVSKDRQIEILEEGGFFGEEQVLNTQSRLFEARFTRRSKVYVIPGEALEDIPIVQLKLLEKLKKRMKILKMRFGIEWCDEYSVGIQQLDEQHRVLFRIANDLLTASEKKSSITRIENLLEELLRAAGSHFTYEETLMKKNGYPGYNAHRDVHIRLLHDIDGFLARLKHEKRKLLPELLEFLREWLIRHTLTVDRKYIKFFRDKEVS